ncbi:MAG: hypothetical protein AB7S26_26460 [Sandaracinaceae bacterium]
MEPPDEPSIDDEPRPGRLARALSFLRAHRRRFQLAAIAVFVVAVSLELNAAYPREVAVAMRFPDAAEVRRAEVEVRDGEDLVQEVTLSFANGAPREVRDAFELSPGEYALEVDLTFRSGESRVLRGELTAPADGVVRVGLR